MTTPEGGNVEAAAAAATGGTGSPQGSNGNQGGGQQQDENAPKFTQADYNRFEARIRHQYEQKAEADKALIEKGKQVAQQEQEQKPLAERLQSISAESAQKDSTIAAKDLTITRIQLAWEAGLPPALGERVQGTTVDEIKADIEKLKAFAQPAGPQTGGGLRPNPQQGAPSVENNRTGSVTAGRDLWSQRHGEKKVDAAK